MKTTPEAKLQASTRGAPKRSIMGPSSTVLRIPPSWKLLA